MNSEFLYMQKLAGIITESEYKELIEGINFMLGSNTDGDPNQKIGDDFKIVFKDPRSAELKLSQMKDKVDYENIGILIKNPTFSQMQSILNSFNDSDIESIGRV